MSLNHKDIAVVTPVAPVMHNSKSKWKSRGGIVMGALLALLGIAAVVLATHWPFTKEKLLKGLREDWPGSVQAGKFHSTVFPRPGCDVEDLVLEMPSVRAHDPLVITIQRAHIRANYPDLFLRPGHLARLVAEGLRITVPVYDANIPSQADKPAPKHSSTSLGTFETANAVLTVKRSRGKEPLTFDIHHVLLESVRSDAPMTLDATILNPEPRGEVTLRAQFGPWESRHLKDIPVTGAYKFDRADLGPIPGIAGILSSAGAFEGMLGHIAAHGSVDIPNFEVTRSHHPVSVKATFQGSVNATDGDTTLDQVDASIRQTVIHAEGSIASGAESLGAAPVTSSSVGGMHGKREGPGSGERGKTAVLNLTVRRGRIQDVLELFVRAKTPPMDGVTSFQARVVIPPGEKPFLKKVMLEGEFAIERAVLTNAVTQNKIDLVSKRASGKKDDEATAKVSAVMKGRVALRDGTANFSTLSYEVPGAQVTMKGRYDLSSEKIDLHGDAKTESELSKQASGLKALLLKPLDPILKKKHAGADVRVGMTGTYENPHFGVELPIKK